MTACVPSAAQTAERPGRRGKVTPLAHAAARLAANATDPGRAYLAAYESGVYRTDDGGHNWRHLPSYPSDYAHSVLVHPTQPQTVYAGSEPAAIFRSLDGGETWEECSGFRAVPESSQWFFHSETRDSHVRDIRMAPDSPDGLYAGIEVGEWYVHITAAKAGGNCPAPTTTSTSST